MSIEYYNNNSTSFYSSTATIDMSAIYDRFLPWIPPAGKILDAGCGSGRDSKAFIEKGYHVTPIDGSVNMAALASANLKMHVLPLKFKYMSYHQRFDGIWASASFLHVPLKQADNIFNKFMAALTWQGVCYMSFKYGTGERYKNDRCFVDHDEESFTNFVKYFNFVEIADMWKTFDQRPGREKEIWLNCIVRKQQLIR